LCLGVFVVKVVMDNVTVQRLADAVRARDI